MREGLGGHVTIHAEFHLETIRKWSVAEHELNITKLSLGVPT